jgi:hypothetical protein
MSLPGYSESLNGYNTKIKSGQAVASSMVKAVLCPIGTIVAWDKCFGTAESGTTSSASAGKLIQTGQDFLTTCVVGMVVFNSTDSTFSYITSVDDNENLTINDDIMGAGDNYIIYKTPYLPDGWKECDGSVINDSDSPYDGETIRDMNNLTQSFIRGANVTGAVGGNDTHTHTFSVTSGTPSAVVQYTSGGNAAASSAHTHSVGGTSAAGSSLPTYVEMVWIQRIK